MASLRFGGIEIHYMDIFLHVNWLLDTDLAQTIERAAVLKHHLNRSSQTLLVRQFLHSLAQGQALPCL